MRSPIATPRQSPKPVLNNSNSMRKHTVTHTSRSSSGNNDSSNGYMEVQYNSNRVAHIVNSNNNTRNTKRKNNSKNNSSNSKKYVKNPLFNVASELEYYVNHLKGLSHKIDDEIIQQDKIVNAKLAEANANYMIKINNINFIKNACEEVKICKSSIISKFDSKPLINLFSSNAKQFTMEDIDVDNLTNLLYGKVKKADRSGLRNVIDILNSIFNDYRKALRTLKEYKTTKQTYTKDIEQMEKNSTNIKVLEEMEKKYPNA